MKVKEFKVGDYVEVTDDGDAGIEKGEQGIILDDSDQGDLDIMFPASTFNRGIWARGERLGLGNFGWLGSASQLKLLYRPRQRKEVTHANT